MPPDRPVPDYDGRPDPRPGARSLLWIPRILFAPLYAISEFVIRRPLEFLFRLVPEGPAVNPLDAIAFGPNDNIAIVPSFYLDFGRQPSAGFYFWWNEAGSEHHQIRAHFGTWGPRWLTGTVLDRIVSRDERINFEMRGELTTRPDGLFYGLGSQARNRELIYQYRVASGTLELEAEPWRASHVRIWSGVRDVIFGVNPDEACDPCGLPLVVALAPEDRPPGFEDGFLIYEHGTEVVLDTRLERPQPLSGVQLRVHGDHAIDLRDPIGHRWFKLGASIGGFLELGPVHVASLVLSASVARPIAGEVPFTELVMISGSGPMRGFATNRLQGDSGASALFEWSWPIWMYLQGVVHVGFGNVFDGVFDGFAFDRLRMSFGVGIAALHSRDHVLDITLGWGTDEIGDGPNVVSFRFTIGATQEF